MSILPLILEVGTTNVFGSLGRVTLIGGNGFIGRFGVVGCIIVAPLEIGMVGKLMVVGSTFPTFKICPVLPFDVFMILSLIMRLLDIEMDWPLHIFTTPFLTLVSAMVMIALTADGVAILLELLMDIPFPLICGELLRMPFVIDVSLVLRLPFTIGSGS